MRKPQKSISWVIFETVFNHLFYKNLFNYRVYVDTIMDYTLFQLLFEKTFFTKFGKLNYVPSIYQNIVLWFKSCTKRRSSIPHMDLYNLQKSASFAVLSHRDQYRWDDAESPLATHLASISQKLSMLGVTDTVIIASAWLSNVLSNTWVTTAMLRKLFGIQVAEIVQELCPNHTNSIVEQKKEQLAKAPMMSNASVIIRLADIEHNLVDLLQSTKMDPVIKLGYFVWSSELLNAMPVVQDKYQKVYEILVYNIQTLIQSSEYNVDNVNHLEKYYCAIQNAAKHV